MAQRFADHEEHALHIDSRYNALKQGSEVGVIVAKFINY